MKIIQLSLTEEQAKHILHALKCTNTRNNHGDLINILSTVEEVEKELYNQLYKL